MGIRRQAREASLQALFMCDFLGKWDVPTIELFFQNFECAENVQEYARALCVGVLDNRVKIDTELTCASENWSLSRMGRVDRAILRSSTYELIYCEDVPSSVAINEAIEVAKRYGSDESPQFVNGVLDRVAKSRKTAEVSQLTANIEFEKRTPAAEETLTTAISESVSAEVAALEIEKLAE